MRSQAPDAVSSDSVVLLRFVFSAAVAVGQRHQRGDLSLYDYL